MERTKLFMNCSINGQYIVRSIFFLPRLIGALFVLALLFPGLKSFAQDEISGTYYKLQKPPASADTIELQPLIDAAKPGDTILLKPIVYSGPVVIAVKRLVIDGQGKAVIDGMSISSVIFIEADSVQILNCTLRNSGGLHDKINAGVTLKGNYNVIENCRIEECLFGIDVFKSQYNRIIHNEISSLTRRSTALKGDAIRFWWAQFNQVIGNYWHNSRDMVVWYSAQNLFQYNKGVGNRYGIHFMYAHNNRIQNNTLINNSVGVFLMYSERTIMTGNYIMGNHRGSGMCLGMKETSSNQILNNRFIYSTEGIHIDVSPYVPEQTNTIEHNEIAFCGTAVYFHSNQEGNLFKQNYFHNNLAQVVPEVTTARFNDWDNNYWDDYQGFDKNKDNIGDYSYKLYSYIEHLWDFNKNVKFFYGAPILAVLDFLERLAPFSKPKFVLEDKKPMYKWKEQQVDKPMY
jgi:nitrous oxidase accessory protein